MEYHIRNKKTLNEGGFSKLFEDEVKDKLPKIENKLKNITKPTQLNIYLKKVAGGLFQIKTTLRLADKELIASTQSDNPVTAVNNLMDNLALQIQKELPRIRKEHLFKRKRHVNRIGELLAKMEESKAESIETFNKTIVSFIPTLKSYILNYLLEQGLNIKSELTIPELINEIYLMLYNNITERPTDDTRFLGWVFSETKKWLDNYLVQSANTNRKQIDIHSLTMQELSSLEQQFTMDADGELVMFEDLDDISYFNEQMTQHDEKGEYDNLLLTEENISGLNDTVQKVLKSIDPKAKLIYEMYWFNDMTEHEIAATMGWQLEKVLQTIKTISKQIVSSLKS